MEWEHSKLPQQGKRQLSTNIKRYKQLFNSPEFHEGNLELEFLMNRAEELLYTLLNNHNLKKSMTAGDRKLLESFFQRIAIEVLLQTASEANAKAVEELCNTLKLTTTEQPLGRKTLYRLSEYLRDICDSFFAFGLGTTSEHFKPSISLQNAYQLTEILIEMVECDELKTELRENKSELLLAAMLQKIINTTLRNAWPQENEKEIFIDGVAYPVPLNIYQQYEAIQHFFAGENAEVIAEQVVNLGDEPWSFPKLLPTKNKFI